MSFGEILFLTDGTFEGEDDEEEEEESTSSEEVRSTTIPRGAGFDCSKQEVDPEAVLERRRDLTTKLRCPGAPGKQEKEIARKLGLWKSYDGTKEDPVLFKILESGDWGLVDCWVSTLYLSMCSTN